MQTEVIDRVHKLESGQLWKIEHGYLYIVEVGKRLVHYKSLSKPAQRVAVIRMIGVAALLNYLLQCEGELVA